MWGRIHPTTGAGHGKGGRRIKGKISPGPRGPYGPGHHPETGKPRGNLEPVSKARDRPFGGDPNDRQGTRLSRGHLSGSGGSGHGARLAGFQGAGKGVPTPGPGGGPG